MNRLFPLATAVLATVSLARSQTPQITEVNHAYGLSQSELVHLDLEGSLGQDLVATLAIDGREERLLLTPNSVRAAGFQLLEQKEDGSLVAVDPGPVSTYRGLVGGIAGATVVGGLQDSGLYAKLVMPDNRVMWLQPIKREFPQSDERTYVLYDAADVIEDASARCGVTAGMNHISVPGGGTTASAGTGQIQIAEIACDTDFEYFLDYGSVTNASNRIQAVMLTLNLQYEDEVDLTHQITTILVRSNANNPYTSSDAFTLLTQFQTEWLTNQGGIQRDVAHLFTGKTVDGSTIGIAFLAAICTSSGFGLSESDFNNNFACATDLTAHELGHNWSGNHCTCPTATMNPFITCSNTFNAFSINEITAFAASINCLSLLDLGVNYCNQTNPNTTGNLGQITASGSNVTSDNNFLVTSSDLPNGEFSYFIASQTQGFVPNPSASQGNLCVLGNIARFNQPGELGVITGGGLTLNIDLNSVPEPSGTGSIFAGETWNFQGWHRDFLPGSGPTSHFTNGYSVQFQ